MSSDYRLVAAIRHEIREIHSKNSPGTRRPADEVCLCWGIALKNSLILFQATVGQQLVQAPELQLARAPARSGTHISADDSGSRISFKERSAVDKLGNWVEGSRRRSLCVCVCVCVCVLSGTLFNNIATGCIVQHRLEIIR